MTHKQSLIDLSDVLVHAAADLRELAGNVPEGVSQPATSKPIELINGRPILDRFKFGRASLDRINTQQLIPPMRQAIVLALRVSEQDFTVFETRRTLHRQRELIRKGFSRTMQSKHLIQSDNYCHAADLVPWIDGKPVWDWDGCYKIACAIDAAATHLGYARNIRWGGAWDRVLADFGGDESAYREEVEAYKARHAGKDFIDGPHYEWVAA